MRRVAGLIRPVNADLLPLMPGFLAEMGVAPTLPRDEAGWLLARFVAEGISEGRITPYEGASFIWREIVNELWPNQQHPLLSFVGSASEYEDCESCHHPEKTRRQIEKGIIKDARALLENKNNC